MPGMDEIVDYTTHFMGDWNGTGACTSHHGSQCCYVDASNLAAAHVVDQAKSWSFTRCMFSNQEGLCPKTWDGDKQECGTEAYDAPTFSYFASECMDSAGFTRDEHAAVDAAMGSLSPSDWVHDALVADYAYTTKNDPGAPHPAWVVVDGDFVDSGTPKDRDPKEWAAAVVKKICDAYAGDKPEACSQ